VLARIYGEDYEAWRLKEAEAAVKRVKQADFSRYLREVGPLPAGARLLDCGASTGLVIELAKGQGLDAYAIELSHFGAEACRQVVDADHVYEGEVENAWFPANPEARFEIITLLDVIEHVRDPRAVLRWVASHLSPGGSLLLVTPQVDSLSHRLMSRWWFHYHIEHLWYFSRASLTALLVEAGFAIGKICPVYKTFSFDYFSSFAKILALRDQCMHPAIPRTFSFLDHIFPSQLRSLPFPFPVGEMLAHAHV
jgi:SAM-dependent methyltransferase